MFTFGKKKRYTIGEKLSYFRGILTDSKANIKKKDWARLRSKQLNEKKNKMRLGDVFVIEEAVFDKNGNKIGKKPRVVVVGKVDRRKPDRVSIIPAYKQNKLMMLSQFDEQRLLSANNAVVQQKNQLYELRGFRFKKPYLTNRERVQLQKISDKYIPQIK